MTNTNNTNLSDLEIGETCEKIGARLGIAVRVRYFGGGYVYVDGEDFDAVKAAKKAIGDRLLAANVGRAIFHVRANRSSRRFWRLDDAPQTFRGGFRFTLTATEQERYLLGHDREMCRAAIAAEKDGAA